MNQSSFKVREVTSSEVADAVVKCGSIMEKSIYEDFDVDRNILKRNVAAYIYSLFSLLSCSYNSVVDKTFIIGVSQGIMSYLGELVDDNPHLESFLDSIHEDCSIYSDVAWHELSVKGRYQDSFTLNKVSKDKIWSVVLPTVPLKKCNPGLMPFVFIDFLLNPKVKLEYRRALPFHHDIKRRFDFSWMKCSPEMTLYNHCVEPLFYLGHNGLIPEKVDV